MIIKSGRLTLRAAEPEDARFAAALLDSDHAIGAYGPHFPMTHAEAVERLTQGGTRSLVAECTDNRVAVGLLRFRLSWGDTVMTVEDVVVDEALQGRGYGREALHALAEHFFRRWGGHRIELQLRADNTRARRTYEALGFVVEGARRNVLPAGWGPTENRDYLMMGLLPTELLAP